MATHRLGNDAQHTGKKMMLTHMQRDEYFMEKALKEAEIAAERGEIPIGAVIVCKKEIVAKDHNRTVQLNDATAHAELLALTAAQNHIGSRYLNSCELYITLEPCCMCAGALFWTQIGRVVVGASDKERGFRTLNPHIIHPKTQLAYGIMGKESEILIKNFFRKIRNK